MTTTYQPIATVPKDGSVVILYQESHIGEDPLIIGAKWVTASAWLDGGYWSAPGGMIIHEPSKWAPAPADAPVPAWDHLWKKLETAAPDGVQWRVVPHVSDDAPHEKLEVFRLDVGRVERFTHFLTVQPDKVAIESQEQLSESISEAFRRSYG